MALNKKRVLLLIDGDMIAFSHCAAEEYGKEPEEINFAKIVQSMDAKMDFLQKRLGATTTITTISGDTNMRHVISPEYKANRDGVWRPENLKNAKAHLLTCWDGVKMDGLEADDLMAMFATYKYEMVMGKRNVIKELIYQGVQDEYDEIIIASLDKDLRQLGKPNPTGDGPTIKHYQWERESLGIGEKLITVSGFGELKCIIKDSGKTKKKEVKGNGPKFFLWQLLTGDGTDGVIGCGIRETKIYKSGAKAGQEYLKRDGVGAVEAFELLDNVTSYAEGLNIVATQYLLRFADGWQKELLKNGRLLYMAKKVEEGHKVLMWHYKGGIKEYFDLNTKQLIPASV